MDTVNTAVDEVTRVMREERGITAGMSDNFRVFTASTILDSLTSTVEIFTVFLGFIAGVSLLVGGINIMNIMLVTITERTREIGLRMAVGARPKDILRQFLVEAVVLCLMGGFMGIVLGRGVAELVHLLLRWPTELSLLAIVAAVGVSAFVGVAFGYYPAWKASRLDPIDALRYE
ncbi:MAG: FtsX-like permease family protein, partial [Planctomycetes bacterium]|nr:FtsX-like permease family protein [Planctomycetota bacterium]